MSETILKQQPAAVAATSTGRRGESRAKTARPAQPQGPGFFAPFTNAWRHREFILAILRRDLADRFRGSMIGWVWAVAGPLITLAIYVVAFTGAMRLPAASAQGSPMTYAFSTFVGLIVFNLCAELFYRAPLLLHEHGSYIKTSIFPSETLAWTTVLRGLTYAGISTGVLFVFALAINRSLPWTVLLLPLLVLPLVLLLLGLVWCLSALGAFTRDIAYLMVSIIPMLLFATPVFYRWSDVPASVRPLEYLNPIAVSIDMARNILIDGVVPSVPLYLVLLGVALLVCRGGYAVFDRYKGIIVDVI